MPHGALYDRAGDLIDVTTTSVGRLTLVDAYTTFLAHARFPGRFRIIVTIDPAYGVDEAEIRATDEFLTGLRDHPKVAEVIVERFPRQAGLAGALSVLMAYAATPIGMHLEDDWSILGAVDLEALCLDLLDQESTQICLANTHVARGGTFDRPGETEALPGTRVPLLRFTPASWAASYLPLCPHIHRTSRWVPTVARALALSDPSRCPEEQIKEHISAEGSVRSHNVLWTRQILARDLGRQWLAQRGLVKAVIPDHRDRAPEPLLPAADRRRPAAPRAARIHSAVTRSQPGSRSRTVPEGRPRYFDRGSGAIIWDVDGRSYVDFDCADGLAVLGHDHPAVTNAIRERAGKGVRLPGSAAGEVVVAELLAGATPGAEMAHLTCTADDALRVAAALSRHLTGRRPVLYAGGRGGEPCPGSLTVPLDTAADVRRVCGMAAGGDWAAVVVQPPLLRIMLPEEARLLREACEASRAVLVLDEAVTTLHLARGGFSALHGVTFDLVCLSSAVCGGMPLAGLAGQRHLMRHLPELGTALPPGPDRISVETAKAVLRQCSSQSYYEHIAQLGTELRDGLNRHASRHGWPRLADGYPGMPCLRFSADPQRHAALVAAFAREMAAYGVLIGGDILFVTAAHTGAQIRFAVAAAEKSLRAVAGDAH